MIHAQGLTRTFRSGKQTVEAVKGIDLDVGDGELVAFLGPNGAGKSTTLRMLTSLLPPTSGTAVVAGVDVAADPAGVRARIGYVGQRDGAGHSYRVWDELRMQGRFYGLSRHLAAARAKELMGDLDLQGMEMRQVSTLSGGQRRRLDIALGLIHSPQLLFLDEPSTGMDPQNRANLWGHITRLRERHGTTIVLTTHYLEEADAMAERVIVIDHGRIIADDTPAALKDDLAGDRITLTVAQADASPTLELAERLGEVVDTSVGDRGSGAETALTIRVDSGPTRLPQAIGELQAGGVRVHRATVRQPTLDDVFLTLTGRSLREGAEAA